MGEVIDLAKYEIVGRYTIYETRDVILEKIFVKGWHPEIPNGYLIKGKTGLETEFKFARIK